MSGLAMAAGVPPAGSRLHRSSDTPDGAYAVARRLLVATLSLISAGLCRMILREVGRPPPLPWPHSLAAGWQSDANRHDQSLDPLTSPVLASRSRLSSLRMLSTRAALRAPLSSLSRISGRLPCSSSSTTSPIA